MCINPTRQDTIYLPYPPKVPTQRNLLPPFPTCQTKPNPPNQPHLQYHNNNNNNPSLKTGSTKRDIHNQPTYPGHAITIIRTWHFPFGTCTGYLTRTRLFHPKLHHNQIRSQVDGLPSPRVHTVYIGRQTRNIYMTCSHTTTDGVIPEFKPGS